MSLNELKQISVKILSFYNNNELITNIFFSFFILFIFIALRKLLTSNISNDLAIDVKRKKYVSIRNNLVLLSTLFLFFIWSTELKTLTVSLLAIAAAVVIATKEVIMSFIGGLLRMTMKKYHVGTRIEIKDYVGDVIDVSMLATTLMEINKTPGVNIYTGQIIVFPHSYLLTEAFKVHHLTSEYIVHTFSLPVEKSENVLNFKQILTDITHKYCEPFFLEAKNHFEKLKDHTSIDMPSTDSKILIRNDDSGCWWLTVRMVVPRNNVQQIEQEIISNFLKLVDKHLKS